MARKPQVTRTITTTDVEVMCLDVEHGEAITKSATLPRTYKTEKELMKAVREKIETETVKPVQVVKTTINEQLYGMTEEEFISVAHKLEKRN